MLGNTDYQGQPISDDELKVAPLLWLRIVETPTSENNDPKFIQGDTIDINAQGLVSGKRTDGFTVFGTA